MCVCVRIVSDNNIYKQYIYVCVYALCQTTIFINNIYIYIYIYIYTWVYITDVINCAKIVTTYNVNGKQ